MLALYHTKFQSPSKASRIYLLLATSETFKIELFKRSEYLKMAIEIIQKNNVVFSNDFFDQLIFKYHLSLCQLEIFTILQKNLFSPLISHNKLNILASEYLFFYHFLFILHFFLKRNGLWEYCISILAITKSKDDVLISDYWEEMIYKYKDQIFEKNNFEAFAKISRFLDLKEDLPPSFPILKICDHLESINYNYFNSGREMRNRVIDMLISISIPFPIIFLCYSTFFFKGCNNVSNKMNEPKIIWNKSIPKLYISSILYLLIQRWEDFVLKSKSSKEEKIFRIHVHLPFFERILGETKRELKVNANFDPNLLKIFSTTKKNWELRIQRNN